MKDRTFFSTGNQLVFLSRRQEPSEKLLVGSSEVWSRRIGMEPATCGLRISRTPTSDNLNPQETTSQDAPDMGPDGAELSSPGSTVVAETDAEEGQ